MEHEPMQIPNPKNRIASKGKFRLLLVDTFEGPFAEYVKGDYPTKEDAIAAGVRDKGGEEMNKYYVYDDKGKFIAEAGEKESRVIYPPIITLAFRSSESWDYALANVRESH